MAEYVIDPSQGTQVQWIHHLSGAKVYCVICIEDDGTDPVHIFSTPEAAQSFMDADSGRNHVAYDYVIDCPERMEGKTQ